MSDVDCEGERLARTVLRGGGVKVARNVYRYKGQHYRIVEGRCVTREEAERHVEAPGQDVG